MEKNKNKKGACTDKTPIFWMEKWLYVTWCSQHPEIWRVFFIVWNTHEAEDGLDSIVYEQLKPAHKKDH